MKSNYKLLLLSDKDNCLVVKQTLYKGEVIEVAGKSICLDEDVKIGFKLARRHIKNKERIIKLGMSIGVATKNIEAGSVIHIHNMKSGYIPTYLRGGRK